MSGRRGPLCGAQGPAGGRQVTALGVTGFPRRRRGGDGWSGGGGPLRLAGPGGPREVGAWACALRPRRSTALRFGTARPCPFRLAAAVGGFVRSLSPLAGRPLSAERAAAPACAEVARLPAWRCSAGRLQQGLGGSGSLSLTGIAPASRSQPGWVLSRSPTPRTWLQRGRGACSASSWPVGWHGWTPPWATLCRFLFAHRLAICQKPAGFSLAGVC